MVDITVIKAEVIRLIKPNRIFWIFEKDNPNHKKIHIRDIVDGDIVVFCFWRKRKQYWQYCCEDLFYFQLLYEHGNLKRAK